MDLTSIDVHHWIMNKATADELAMVQSAIQLKAQTQFRVGTKVYFDAKTRGIVHGVIVKVNGKSVKVQTKEGVQWKVSPGLLNKDDATG